MDMLLNEAIGLMKQSFGEKLSVIETGTIRSKEETTKSTLYLSESIGKDGTLISVDINKDHIKISKAVCKGKKNIKWIHSDSVEYLDATDKEFHLAYLDSLNDAEHIFNEFKAVMTKMITDGIIIIDDAGVGNGTAAKKGLKIHTFLKFYKISFKLIDTPHGGRIIIELKTKTLNKIVKGLNAD